MPQLFHFGRGFSTSISPTLYYFIQVAREGPALAEVGGTLYAIGGKGSGGTVEAYDNDGKEWKLVEELQLNEKHGNEEYSCEVLKRIV